jgi:hypothetical protein
VVCVPIDDLAVILHYLAFWIDDQSSLIIQF